MGSTNAHLNGNDKPGGSQAATGKEARRGSVADGFELERINYVLLFPHRTIKILPALRNNFRHTQSSSSKHSQQSKSRIIIIFVNGHVAAACAPSRTSGRTKLQHNRILPVKLLLLSKTKLWLLLLLLLVCPCVSVCVQDCGGEPLTLNYFNRQATTRSEILIPLSAPHHHHHHLCMAAAVYQSWYGCGTQTMTDGRRPRSPAADDDYDDDDDNYCGAAAAISSVDEAGCTVTYISLFLLNILFSQQFIQGLLFYSIHFALSTERQTKEAFIY